MKIRVIAYNLIRNWDESGEYPNLALKNALRLVENERDRRFISAIVYGVVEKKITLDHFIRQCSARPIDKISSAILNALRMGVYQMFYLNVPESAACNTMVEIVKMSGFSHSCGFVNAVLRRCAREKEELLLLKKADYSVRFSITPQIVDLLLEQYGKETFLKIIDGIESRDHSMYLFHNHCKGTEAEFVAIMQGEGVELKASEIPHLFKANKGFSVEASAAYKDGWFHVIGLNSARAAALIPCDAKNILDLCAAPGGKTFVMAANTKAEIIAFDIHAHKVDLMNKSAKRLGHDQISFLNGDSSVLNPQFIETADAVLCDVPCSGLGIMGKKPDIKYKDYDSISLRDTQYKILENGSRYLKKGGLLVYSTCTLDRRENEDQIDRFMKEHLDFNLDQTIFKKGMETYLPDGAEDGFFIAVLRKD